MKTIQELIEKGLTQAAFKYKANAAKFARAWEKKGYYISYIRSSGPVVDAEERVLNAYYVMAEKESPEPYTAKQLKEIERYKEMDRLHKANPVAYYQKYIKPYMTKKGVLDPAIRDLVLELNENNQFTTSSCSGHGNKRGHLFIWKNTFNGNLVRAIFKKYGLTGITRDAKDYVTNEGDRYVVYEFDPLSKK